MSYWEVVAKCGHVRKTRFILKTFFVEAADGKEAAMMVREKPRVKHHHKDAIRSVKEISREEFLKGNKAQKSDPYFKAHSKQEQNATCEGIDIETYYEEKPTLFKKKTHARQHLREKQQIKEWNRERRNRPDE